MTAVEPTQAAVRLRLLRAAYTSGLMPLIEAAELTEQLHAEVVACGDGCEFVQMLGFDGRVVHVRGRDVIAVEYLPNMPDRIRPPDPDRPGKATGGYVSGRGVDAGGATVTMTYPPHGVGPSGVQDAGGTEFLRGLAARQASMDRHPAGRHQ